VLKAAVHREAERIAWRAVDACLDPELPSEKALRGALDLIEAADPQPKAELRMSADLTPEGVQSMSYSELLSFAQAHGIDSEPMVEP
jgi:hypothetical protein